MLLRNRAFTVIPLRPGALSQQSHICNACVLLSMSHPPVSILRPLPAWLLYCSAQCLVMGLAVGTLFLQQGRNNLEDAQVCCLCCAMLCCAVLWRCAVPGAATIWRVRWCAPCYVLLSYAELSCCAALLLRPLSAARRRHTPHAHPTPPRPPACSPCALVRYRCTCRSHTSREPRCCASCVSRLRACCLLAVCETGGHSHPIPIDSTHPPAHHPTTCFSIMTQLTVSFAAPGLLIERIPIYQKQRDAQFYPGWWVGLGWRCVLLLSRRVVWGCAAFKVLGIQAGPVPFKEPGHACDLTAPPG